MLGTFLNQRGSLRYLRHSVPSILKTLYVIQKYTQSKKMPVVYLQYTNGAFLGATVEYISLNYQPEDSLDNLNVYKYLTVSR